MISRDRLLGSEDLTRSLLSQYSSSTARKRSKLLYSAVLA